MNRHHDIIIKQTVEVEEVMSAIVESSTLSPAGSSRQLRTGDVLCLQDEVFQHSVHFLLEAVSSSTFLFAKLEQPYQRLHITSKEVVFKTSSPNRDNLLFLEENPANGSVVIRTNNKDKPASTSSISKNYNHPPAIVNNWYLGISHDGELTTIPFTSTVLSTSVETRGMISCCFQVVEVLPYSAFSAAAGNSSSSSSSLQAIKSPSNYHIPYYQLQRFVVEGYMHLSEVLSTSLINQLNNYLLHHLGQVGTLVLGGVQGGNTGKFPGNVSNSEEIRQVIDKVQDILREIIHPFGQANPEDDVIYNQKNASAQIAFRYPQLLDYQTNYKAEDIEWHTDGYRQGHSHPFR